METRSIDSSNPFFTFEVSNICATCTKHVLNTRSYSLDTLVDQAANINLYNVLESQFQFKCVENGPISLCTECFSKTILFHEFHKQYKKSVMLFSKYLEHQGDNNLDICETDANSTYSEQAEEQEEKLTIVPEEVYISDTLVKVDEFNPLEEVEGINNGIRISCNTKSNNTNKPTVSECSSNCDVEPEDKSINDYTLVKIKDEFNPLEEIESFESEISCNSMNLNHQGSPPTSKVSTKCNNEITMKSKMFTVESIDNNKLYKCTLCDNVYDKYHSFMDHRNIHNKKHVCSYCGKALGNTSALKIHERRHTGERPYSCGICGKGFTTKGNRDDHLICHAEKRPFQCELCEKTFKTKINLGRHMVVHSLVKTHECGECNRRFISAAYLKKHLRVHEKGNADNDRTEK